MTADYFYTHRNENYFKFSIYEDCCDVRVLYKINLVKFDIIIKALLHVHKAIFLETCLAILLRHKLHESLPSVTCP